MTSDFAHSGNSIHTLLNELVATLYLRPWKDEAEERHKLKKEIIRRVKAGESTVLPLLELLNHEDWAVRHDIADMLGWIGNSDTIQPLIEVMRNDKSKSVCGSVALALERIGTPDAVAAYTAYRDAIKKT